MRVFQYLILKPTPFFYLVSSHPCCFCFKLLIKGDTGIFPCHSLTLFLQSGQTSRSKQPEDLFDDFLSDYSDGLNLANYIIMDLSVKTSDQIRKSRHHLNFTILLIILHLQGVYQINLFLSPACHVWQQARGVSAHHVTNVTFWSLIDCHNVREK